MWEAIAGIVKLALEAIGFVKKKQDDVKADEAKADKATSNLPDAPAPGWKKKEN